MGIIRFKWVGMGAHGCVGTHNAWATQKQGKKGVLLVSQTKIWVLWPGKFPRTSCFGVFGKKWCGWLQMGAKRFRWVRMDPYAKREARTSKKEPQISEKWTYCEACAWLNLIGRWEQLVWCSQRAIPRDLGVTHRWCLVCNGCAYKREEKTQPNAPEKTKTSQRKMV